MIKPEEGSLPAAQAGQPDSGVVEASVGGKHLSVDVTGGVAAEKPHCFRYFLLQPVAVQRDRVVVGGPDIGCVYLLGHGGVHRTGSNGIDADSHVAQFRGLLLRELHNPCLAGAVGHP